MRNCILYSFAACLVSGVGGRVLVQSVVLQLPVCCPSGVISEYVNPYTHTNPRGRLKWPYANTRLTAHIICGLMSDLVICNFRKSMVIHDTECPYWNQVSLNNTNQTKPVRWSLQLEQPYHLCWLKLLTMVCQHYYVYCQLLLSSWSSYCLVLLSSIVFSLSSVLIEADKQDDNDCCWWRLAMIDEAGQMYMKW